MTTGHAAVERLRWVSPVNHLGPSESEFSVVPRTANEAAQDEMAARLPDEEFEDVLGPLVDSEDDRGFR